MAITVRTVFADGVLHHSEPLPLAEGASVDVTVAPNPAAAPQTDEEIVRQISCAKSYRDWLEVTKTLPADDGGYDIIKALDDNRRWSGEAPFLQREG